MSFIFFNSVNELLNVRGNNNKRLLHSESHLNINKVYGENFCLATERETNNTVTETRINSKPTLVVPFHNTLYQYLIHSRPDTHAVYTVSLKIEGILFEDFSILID